MHIIDVEVLNRRIDKEGDSFDLRWLVFLHLKWQKSGPKNCLIWNWQKILMAYKTVEMLYEKRMNIWKNMSYSNKMQNSMMRNS